MDAFCISSGDSVDTNGITRIKGGEERDFNWFTRNTANIKACIFPHFGRWLLKLR